jgi:hypothetical protein
MKVLSLPSFYTIVELILGIMFLKCVDKGLVLHALSSIVDGAALQCLSLSACFIKIRKLLSS